MSLPPFIVDTDMAFDDWLALLYLLRSEQIDLRAITIAGTGEAHGYFGRCHALRLLTLSGATPCAVATGRAKPLQGKQAFPWLVRLAMDCRLGIPLPSPAPNTTHLTATALLAQTLRQATTPVTLVTLGPLTNLAETLSTEPQLVTKLAMIYCMGGALDVPGNLGELMWRPPNTYAEWNFYIDPQAVAIVLQSGAPMTLVPLDETNRHPLTDEQYHYLMQQTAGATGLFIQQVLRRVRRLTRPSQSCYLWDPLVAVVATNPEIATFAPRKISMIADKNQQWGRLIDDPGGTLVQICTGIDDQKFIEHFVHPFRVTAVDNDRGLSNKL